MNDPNNKQEHTSDAPVFPPQLERLISTIQNLSLARDLQSVVDIVRHEARILTGADGATFILNDNGYCYYVDEDAISPLWKGKRFPMENCISGWVMLNKQSVVIEDIYQDSRIPADAYRPTFVKSLAVVPIRTRSPIGAIGNYWATHHTPSEMEMKMLQALADTTSLALENVKLFTDLKDQVEKYRSLSDKLMESLKEKEVLLKEVYHRVKNNLQIISSLLNLQSGSIDDVTLKRILIDSINRIHAMSVLHEMLYQSNNKASIVMADYIKNIVAHIYKISDTDSNRIQYHSEMDHVILNLDQAIPCGLAINELISNVFKHAYPDNQAGEFSIVMKQNGNMVTISVRDNGVGMQEHASKTKKSLGLSLVRQLGKQLGDDVTIKVDKGTEVTISFPVTING